MKRRITLILILSVTCGGCQTGGNAASTPASSSPESTRAAQAGPAGNSNPSAAAPPLGFINAKPVSWPDLQPALIEASGGVVLAEHLLDLLIAQQMTLRQQTLTPAALAAERESMAQAMSRDPDEAARMLRELREARGLGDERFARLLSRNAALRLLVRDEVQVTEAAVRQAFELQYGPRFELRLIVADTLRAASEMANLARKGDSFAELAARRSRDSSSAQGGLLTPISPADADYPQAIRNVMVRLQPNEVSDPIALDRGFAVIRLERKIAGSNARFDDVRKDLELVVRRQVEGVMMKRLARGLLAKADVVILDPALQKAWQAQKRRMETEK